MQCTFTEEELKPALNWAEANLDLLEATFHKKWKTAMAALKGFLSHWGSYVLITEKRDKEKVKQKWPNNKVEEPEWKQFLLANPQYGLDADKAWPRKERRDTLKKLKTAHKKKNDQNKRKKLRTFVLSRPSWEKLRPESYDHARSQ